jgi:hypothetical protein
MTRSTGQNAEEVVQHLAGLVGATIRVMIESEADIPDGAPDNVMRTVTENCRTLHFQSFKFEEA